MGYYTTVRGTIDINPPLDYRDLRKMPTFPRSWGPDVRLEIEEETEDTSEGELTRKFASTLVPRSQDSYKAYYLLESLQAFLDTYPDHIFTGYFECFGEENGDIWRLAIRDRKAVRVEPTIVWPED